MSLLRLGCVLGLLFLAHLAGEYRQSTDAAVFLAAAFIIVAMPKEKKE